MRSAACPVSNVWAPGLPPSGDHGPPPRSIAPRGGAAAVPSLAHRQGGHISNFETFVMHADGEGRQGEAGTRAIPRQRTRTEEGERWRLGSTDAERERNPQRGILRLAILSRILTLFLMVLHDAVFRDLSTSAHLQAYPCSWSEQHTGARGPGGARGVGALELAAGQGLPTGDVDAVNPFITALESAMASMTPWDSVYFVRIAQCGYESDQIFAFFPLVPSIMWVGGKLARAMYAGWLLGGHVLGAGQWADELRVALAVFGTDTTTAITSVERIGMVCMGLLVNMGAFCGAAVVLYRLGVVVLRDVRMAYLAAVLFCFNPASVFYSAVYTESLFGMCTWLGVWMVLTRRYWGGVGWLAAAGLARSNGILGVWFLIWAELLGIKDVYTFALGSGLLPPWRRVVRVIVGAAVVCLPYICIQAYGWSVFCRPGRRLGRELNIYSTEGPLQLREDIPSWCDAALPSIYGYVQQKYWDVGFLNFYDKLIRLPFVVQSIPVIVLAGATCWSWTFGPWEVAGRPGRAAALRRLVTLGSAQLDSGISKHIDRTLEHSAVIVAPLVAPFVYHLALMTFVAVFVMHVNVATRFLSSSPLLFWGAAQWILNDPRGGVYQGGAGRRWRVMLVWCAVYLVVGSLMFPNFYPWV